MKHSSKKSSKTLPNLTSSMSTSKAHVTLGLNKKRRNPTTHSLTSKTSCSHTTTCKDLSIQDAFSASAVTNRLKNQTLTHVNQTWNMPYVLLQVILLVQLPISAALLRPALSSPEGRPHSSHKLLQKVLPGITARARVLHPVGCQTTFLLS